MSGRNAAWLGLAGKVCPSVGESGVNAWDRRRRQHVADSTGAPSCLLWPAHMLAAWARCFDQAHKIAAWIKRVLETPLSTTRAMD
jgi:hypothetical protein